MPPRRGRDKTRKVPVDKEVASVPYISLPQGDPQFPLEFLVSPMPQAGFFPLMTHEAFQAYTNYWYAQAQAQAQANQGQFLVPRMTTFVQPPTQPVVKLSKLVKEARQLICETFSSTVDVVAAKN